MPVSINLSRHAAEIHADRDADGSKMSRILSWIERGMVILMSVVGSLLRRRLINHHPLWSLDAVLMLLDAFVPTLR